nr:ribonuclease H-like domain-containing protein [Tanacetum cinerariifolium]
EWILRFPSIYRLRIYWIPIGIVVAVLNRMRELVMKYKAEKVYHEEMVKMPLVDLKVLETSCHRVYRRHLGLHEVKGGTRVTFEDEFGAAKEREVSCEAQQSRSGVKRKLFKSFRNKMTKYHMGKADIVVDAWRRKGGVKPRRDVRTLTLKDAHAMKYSVYPRVSKVWYDLRKRLSLMLLEHKDVIEEFCSPSQWKELSKEMSTRKNKLKARGTLLMALPDKHKLKFHTHKDAKTLMDAIEKSFRGNTKSKKVQKTLLKQQYKNFIGSSSETLDQIHNRLQKLISQLKILRESLSQDDINLKFLRSLPAEWRTHTLIWRNKTDLEEQSLDDLFNSLKIYEAKRTKRNLGANGPTSMGFDMSKVECYNCHEKGHFARECQSPKDTRRNGAAEPQRRNVLVETSTSNALVSHDGSLPPSPIYDRYQSGHRPLAPIIEDWVSDSEDDSEAKILQNNPSFVQPTDQVKTPRPSVKHVDTSILATTLKTAILKPKSQGDSRNRKACFELCKRGNHKQYARMTLQNPQRHVVPTAVLTQSKPVPITAVRQVTTTILKTNVTRPRQAKTAVTKPHSPPRRHMNRKWERKHKCPILDHVSQNTSASMTLKRFNYNDALRRSKSVIAWVPKSILFLVQGNPQHALQDKGVIDSGCSRHMTWNMSYLSDFEELNGGYVTFGRNPKGGKISGKGKIRTGKLDFDDVYFVKELKFNLFSVSQMCNKKNSVLFTDTECLVLSPKFKLPDDTQVMLRVPRENNMYNVDLKNIVSSGDLTCLFVKESEFKGRKPESEVNVSLSSSAQTKKHDDKTKREAKGKIPTVGQIFTDSTNKFSVAGPSNAVVSPTHGKSSYVDSSQLPDDPNIPELEDITYYDDEEDVGAEADFTNLETTITVNPIPTTRVHKDHPVTQIIGDLSLATQTRSMTRVAKDQGGLS